MSRPDRGEIWIVELEPVRGHEQAGRRPALVISVDALNHSSRGVGHRAAVTSRDKRIRTHVRVSPPEGN